MGWFFGKRKTSVGGNTGLSAEGMPTVSIRESERLAVINAIMGSAVPWNLPQDLEHQCRSHAIRCILGPASRKGEVDNPFTGVNFSGAKEARGAATYIMAIGHSARNFERMKQLKVEQFIWRYMPSCSMQHIERDGHEYKVALGYSGFFPGAIYGCTCSASAVLPGL